MSDAGLPVTTVTRLPAVSLQHVSEVIRAHGIVPKSEIINELFEAGVMASVMTASSTITGSFKQ